MTVNVVLLGRDEQLIRRIEGSRGELIIQRVCDDPAEAIAACLAGTHDVLLVASKDLTPPMEHIDQLAARPMLVIVLSAEPKKHLDVQGYLEVFELIDITGLEELILKERTALLHQIRGTAESGPDGLDGPETRDGRVVCIWGAAGSPGRSTVALNYAVEAALAGSSVVLIDADTYAASISIQLGLMDETASIAQLCRIVDSGSTDVQRLRSACLTVEVAKTKMLVATGIPRASRWPEVRAAALRRAIQALRRQHDLIVVDVAALIEQDEQLSFDTQAPQRNAVSVEMLHCADAVYMVVAADSLGIPRALRSIDELTEKGGETELNILFNKMTSANTGRSAKRRLLEAWDRFGPTYPIVGYLPNDPAVCHAAVLAGSPLAEIAPKSTLRQEIRALVSNKSTEYVSTTKSRRFTGRR